MAEDRVADPEFEAICDLCSKAGEQSAYLTCDCGMTLCPECEEDHLCQGEALV